MFYITPNGLTNLGSRGVVQYAFFCVGFRAGGGGGREGGVMFSQGALGVTVCEGSDS